MAESIEYISMASVIIYSLIVTLCGISIHLSNKPHKSISLLTARLFAISTILSVYSSIDSFIRNDHKYNASFFSLWVICRIIAPPIFVGIGCIICYMFYEAVGGTYEYGTIHYQ